MKATEVRQAAEHRHPHPAQPPDPPPWPDAAGTALGSPWKPPSEVRSSPRIWEESESGYYTSDRVRRWGGDGKRKAILLSERFVSDHISVGKGKSEREEFPSTAQLCFQQDRVFFPVFLPLPRLYLSPSPKRFTEKSPNSPLSCRHSHTN